MEEKNKLTGLASMLAKQAEPNNQRLSEGDIIRQLKRIGLSPNETNNQRLSEGDIIRQLKRIGLSPDETTSEEPEYYDYFKDISSKPTFVMPEGSDERADLNEVLYMGDNDMIKAEQIVDKKAFDKIYKEALEIVKNNDEANKYFLSLVNNKNLDISAIDAYYSVIKKFGTNKAEGGRIGYQTGGISETRTLPPEYIEAAQKTFLADLTRQAGIPSITTATTQQPGETAEQFAARQAQAQQFGITKAGMADLAPQVAGQDALQTAAYQQATDATTGLGAYQPFLADAKTAATGATALTGPMTDAQTTAYMSPYQTSVIDTTLAEFDRQAQAQKASQAAQALGIPGAFGGGREGVLQAEYQSASDRNRAALQSGLLQQGFQQAQAARQQDLANQMGLANLQSGLGARAQDFSRAQISGLGTLGAQQQAQSQAILDAQRQTAQMAVDDPRRRLSMLGSGITQLTPGAGAVTLAPETIAPQASPLTTALGLGLAGADIYGRIFGGKK
jgi:hypothetical protein